MYYIFYTHFNSRNSSANVTMVYDIKWPNTHIHTYVRTYVHDQGIVIIFMLDTLSVYGS